MKKYNYNTKDMTLEQINEAIYTITNDAEYISADMADRLQGDEREAYDHNNAMLYNLRIARITKREQTVEYWQGVKATQENYIQAWTEELNNKPNALKKCELKRSIDDANNIIAKANKKIEELRG